MCKSRWFARLIFLAATTWLLAACAVGGVEINPHVAWQPRPEIPVRVSIDGRGTVAVDVEGQYVTPLGIFSVGASIELAKLFPNTPCLLTVTVNGQRNVYPLEKRDVNISLESGYYKSVVLRQESNTCNWRLDAIRTDSATAGEVIIDNLNPEFSYDGPITGWRVASYGYQNNTYWTYATNQGISNWGKWTPQLTHSGNYEVSVFIPLQNAGSEQARYKVAHNNQLDEVTVRQSDYADAWVGLGTYFFNAAGDEYLYLDDNTGESRDQAIMIGFDAVRFVRIP